MSTRVVKAHLYRHIRNISEAKDPETRRFNIDQTTASSYNLLKAKLVETFPGVHAGNLKTYWKDSDGDYILFNRDHELRDAFSTLVDDHVFKVHIIAPGTHVCDECGTPNSPGVRYLCRVCPETDLCAACSVAGKHGEHPITKSVRRSGQAWTSFGNQEAGMEEGPDSDAHSVAQ